MIEMGKVLNQQRRGKGSMTWRSPRHKYAPKVSFKDITGKAVVIDLFREAQRSAPQALIEFEEGAAIIPAVQGLFVGQIIDGSESAEVKRGNIVELKDIPDGERVFCIELVPGDGGKIVRGAGATAVVMSKSADYVRVKLPSGKTKDLPMKCRAILGAAAGSGIADKPILKAGKMFHMMKAKHTYWPRVASASMNAAEHPFGGGRKHRHGGICQTASRGAPPGRKVGYIAASRTGRKRK